jgi:uncharacterized protein
MREEPMRIGITGASGLVGSQLSAYLSGTGHTVVPFVRRESRGGHENAGEIAWNPSLGEVDAKALEGLDGVVHLAGESIAARRWTPSSKGDILNSRVMGTRTLCQGLAKMRKPPQVLVSASAIGWYGNRGGESLDERSAPGEGFLPQVCQAWEGATEPAREAAIRVVNLRIGVVLSSKGGALARMITPFKLGLGGPIGTGKQFVSWIALVDLLRVIEVALIEEGLSGPVNATAPEPVMQADFAKTLGRVLHRPAIVPLPSWVVRAAFGEMGQALLLDGAKVLPASLQALGFPFLHPVLVEALRVELGLGL